MSSFKKDIDRNQLQNHLSHILELSSTESIITVINMFRNTYDRMENFTRERNIFLKRVKLEF